MKDVFWHDQKTKNTGYANADSNEPMVAVRLYRRVMFSEHCQSWKVCIESGWY
jgi:hypothetical protein